jgi:flavin reductase (DIM6/NTAB) family NADH-FMN oxidoreductase RutF
MFYEEMDGHGLSFNPWKALVAPRPIGWISTISRAGVPNLAPFSYFNAVADYPPMVMFSPAGPRLGGGAKDTYANILATEEFVVNFVTWELREAMNRTSEHVGPEVDEFEHAGLAKAPSRKVRPPRVAASPVNLECVFVHALRLPTTKPPVENNVVFGRVVGFHIDERIIKDGQIDMAAYRPIARLGYFDYTVVDTVFTLDRPDLTLTELMAELRQKSPAGG